LATLGGPSSVLVLSVEEAMPRPQLALEDPLDGIRGERVGLLGAEEHRSDPLQLERKYSR
jgi:hypothetical protein